MPVHLNDHQKALLLFTQQLEKETTMRRKQKLREQNCC
jgi:hypothetical protein